MKFILATILFSLVCVYGYAQLPKVIRTITPTTTSSNTTTDPNKATVGTTARKDSATLGFEHRDDSKDSVAITYRFLDSVRNVRFDSSINDFDKYFSVPSTYQYLGNNGAAAYPLIYAPYA